VRVIPAGPFAHRNFRLLWFGRTVSRLGDQIAPLALAFAVLDLTGSASDLGYVLAAQRVPLIFLSVFAGVWADRLPRRLVMLGSDVFRGSAQFAIAALLLAGAADLTELVALSVLYGVADVFFYPAAVGLTPATLPPERLQQGNGLLQIAGSATSIVGPATAGLLVALTSPGVALAVDGGTFVASALALAAMRIPAVVRTVARDSLLAEARAGWQEVRSRRWLWAIILYFTFLAIAGLPAFFVLGPYIAKHALGGASAWAAIMTAGGVGSLLGGGVGLRVTVRRPLRACLILLILWWPPALLLAYSTSVALIAAAFFAASFGMGWGLVLWPTTLQRHIPEHSISRVSALDEVGTHALSPLAFALVGPLAAAVGAKDTLAGSAALGLAATLAALGVRDIRRLENPAPRPDAAPATAPI
jgi:Major Facilitator Superfamily